MIRIITDKLDSFNNCFASFQQDSDGSCGVPVAFSSSSEFMIAEYISHTRLLFFSETKFAETRDRSR